MVLGSAVSEVGVQGVQVHLQKFWFGENLDKIPQSPSEICGNLSKIRENFCKIVSCALIFKNGTQN